MVLRVLLCGTNYGSAYLRALYGSETGLKLAGILARSERSRDLAAQCAVPFYTTLEDVPPDAIDAACVAIPAESGRVVTSALLARGIHVLAEHPVGVAEVIAHRATARQQGAVYHVNAHYSDLDAPATFIAAFHGARQRSPLLFVNLQTNPRTLYSSLEMLGRCLGPLTATALEQLPPMPQSFFALAQLIVNGVAVTIQMQRASSAVDDGSSNWVSHNLAAGFVEGMLAMPESQGPVTWMPAPPSQPQLQTTPELWARPLWRLLASPPPTFADFVNGGRDRANRLALARFAREIATHVTEPEQSDAHLLGVSALWEALLRTNP
ncbi:MAG: putative Siderophore-like synthase protein [Acidobacteria bacterium]|nr:putative Siderophore-like synthase protein [Acidobacteriota bacterium]